MNVSSQKCEGANRKIVVHELHVVMGTKGLVNVWESGHELPIIFLKVTTCIWKAAVMDIIYFNAST